MVQILDSGAFVVVKIMAVRVLIIYFLAVVAVVVDFWSGVNKCKRLGLPLFSRQFRRSVIKLNQYLLLIILFTIVDFALVVAGVFPLLNMVELPLFTFFALLVVWTIEVKSVWENTDKGHQRDIKQAVGALGKLVRTRGDIDTIIKELERHLEIKQRVRREKQDEEEAERHL